MADDVSTGTIDWLTPATRMPWPVQVPFRMRPNLEKLDAVSPALLIRDELFDVYQRERAKVIAAHGDRAAVGDANEDALEAIRCLASSPLVGEGRGEGAAVIQRLGLGQASPSPLTPLSSREREKLIAIIA